jgi:hypothetical protein
MKKRIATFSLLAILIIITPNINANTVKKINEENRPYENPDAISYGFIFGITCGSFEHASWRVPLAQIIIENRTIRRSGIFGFYMIFFLQIGKTYTITAHEEGYYSFTETFTLTLQQPIQKIDLLLVPEVNQ